MPIFYPCGPGGNRPPDSSMPWTRVTTILQAQLSGCRESNSDYKHPMLVYYHYTTPRIHISRLLQIERSFKHMLHYLGQFCASVTTDRRKVRTFSQVRSVFKL